MDGSVSADRSDGCGKNLRCRCYPYQQPVRKGGISYILKQNFSISLPQAMKEEVGYAVKQVSDEEHKELSPQWVYEIFEENYMNKMPYFTIDSCHFKQNDGIMAETEINFGGKKTIVDANGNGRLDAVSNTIKQFFGISYELSTYEEHALSHGSSSKAIAYVGITCEGKNYWGSVWMRISSKRPSMR